MERTGTVIGAILWIAGLVLFIVGLNLHGDSGRWMEIIGSIAFLVGLGIIGALRLKQRSHSEQEKEHPESRS